MVDMTAAHARRKSAPGGGTARGTGNAKPKTAERPLVPRAIDGVTEALGHPAALAAAVAVVVAWLAFGPVFGFSDTYQLVINTATTIVTFIMVFAIQNTTNRETRAINLKLDELLEAVQGANTRLVGVEGQSEAAIKTLQAQERGQAARAQGRP